MASSPNKSLTTAHGPQLSKTAGQLLEDFGAGAATPGSGSAAALMGILAAKLVETVCKKSLEKLTGSEKPESRLEFTMIQAQKISARLANNLELDSQEFDKVIELRKARDEAKDRNEAAKISRQENDALENATSLIFEISKDCLDLVDIAKVAFDEGWHAIRGDAGAALSVALAGAMSCAFVANLNAKSLRKRQSGKKIIGSSNALSQDILSRQDTVLRCMGSLNNEASDAVEVAAQGLLTQESTK